MHVYHVSYDLNGDNRNYDDIIKPIQGSPSACHMLGSSWLVLTNESATELYTRLTGKLVAADRIFISRVDGNRHGWVDQRVVDWLKKYA